MVSSNRNGLTIGHHRLVVVEDVVELGRIAAYLVARQLARKPTSVLALPTGRTPLTLYRWLIRLYQARKVDFSVAGVFNLDEFFRIPRESPGSFATYLGREFLSQVNLPSSRIHLLDSYAINAERECYEYERQIRGAGGLDLAIVGIGGNGHIAFNEPGSEPMSRTRLVDLTPETVQASGLFFQNVSNTPSQALTMGVGTILDARRVLLLAAGQQKAAIVARALKGSVNSAVPASYLCCHPRLTVILDREAASCLFEQSLC